MIAGNHSDWFEVNSKSPLVPLKSNFLETLVGTTHGDYVVVPKYRPKSGQTVYPDRYSRILPAETPRGKTTRASVLRALSAQNSSRNIRSSTTWCEKKRLCEIRSDYLCHGHTSLTRPQSTNEKLLRTTSCMSTDALMQRNSSRLTNYLNQSCDNKDVESHGINTEPHFLSIEKWHGAEWQCKLPQMYLPRKEHRNPYGSQVVRSKVRKSRWRDSNEMPGAGFVRHSF